MQTLRVVRSGRVREPAVRYISPCTVFEQLYPLIRKLDREHFMVLHLDSSNHLVGKETISVGTLSEAYAHPREVFKGAILSNSKAIIVVHNHPSGNVQPSFEDIRLTERLTEAGDLLGIPLLDSIILADNDYCSIREHRAKFTKNKRNKEV